ncbi:gamma-aminobutyrate transaminase POP2 [Cucumis melo var. makuwa]|uniref:Gamma-aminobutyrate transaminase POP2 n=1 Tax=Cucumis melo var. makuwa TaxID=1194695 RepID=A0A5A7U0Q1_CUCMM|nr:gamma-aminobutyrate transaminase POP2 [Cucumis melo var. makuwa]TYK22920.1 gamma-aminobutyrate transaminase POP2 [Cucumis melo var. makuwa]
MDDHIEDDTLYKTNVDPTIVERPVVHHVTDGFIDDVDEHLSHASDDDEFSDEPRTYIFIKFIYFDSRYVFVLLVKCLFSMPTSIMSLSYPHNNFLETNVMFLEFADDLDNLAGGSSSVGDNLVSSNDQAMNRFVEHQMLSTFKEFRDDCHTHFKKYSDSRRLVPTHQIYWWDVMHFLCDENFLE